MYFVDCSVILVLIYTINTGWTRSMFELTWSVIAVSADTGALSALYCATVTDIPEGSRGGTVSPGPKVSLVVCDFSSLCM